MDIIKEIRTLLAVMLIAFITPSIIFGVIFIGMGVDSRIIMLNYFHKLALDIAIWLPVLR